MGSYSLPDRLSQLRERERERERRERERERERRERERERGESERERERERERLSSLTQNCTLSVSFSCLFMAMRPHDLLASIH